MPENTAKSATRNTGIFIGIGSNMGDPVQYCTEGIKRVLRNGKIKLLAASSFYSTSPVSPVAQDDFINCAIAVEWNGSPADLLSSLNRVEMDMGRVRQVAGGPRVIDLDILLFGDLVLATTSLIIPHPELHRRKFALVPCLEIDPLLVHPVYKLPLSAFLETIDETQKISLHASPGKAD